MILKNLILLKISLECSFRASGSFFPGGMISMNFRSAVWASLRQTSVELTFQPFSPCFSCWMSNVFIPLASKNKLPWIVWVRLIAKFFITCRLEKMQLSTFSFGRRSMVNSWLIMLKRVLSEYWWHRGDATAKNISYQQPRCPPQADGHYLQPAACQGRFMALGLPGSWQKGFLTQPESMLSLLLKQPCLYRFQKSKKEMEGSECISHFWCLL